MGVATIYKVPNILFLDYKKIDYDSEKDGLIIAKFVFNNADVVNSYQHSKFLKSVQVMEKWPILPTTSLDGHITTEISKIPRDNTKSIEEYIIESKEMGLTHLVVKETNTDDLYFQDLIQYEEKYPFLEKKYEIFNKNDNHVEKIFEIHYEQLEN